MIRILHFRLLLQTAFVSVNCQFLRTPLNTAVLVGQRLELGCQPNNNFTIREWKSQRLDVGASPIYGNWRNSRIQDRRFGFDIDDDGSVGIYLNETQLGDAGLYSCHIHAGTQQPRQCSAHVIVFETEPICEESISNDHNATLEEGSVVWMRCSVNFRGDLTPTMEWRQHRGHGEIDEHNHTPANVNETASVVISETNISSTLTIVIKSTHNATYFTCRTYFQWDNSSSSNSTATNAPYYSYTWNSSVIIVADTTFVPGERETVSVVTSVVTSSTEKGSPSTPGFSLPFNATYLVAGVAVLFGIASSLVAIILCLRLKRKSLAVTAMINPKEQAEGEYDLIPYAITDAYDTIEEVDENDDILFPNFPPRHGPQPLPGYSGLMPEEPKPPGVYSRMDNMEDTDRPLDGSHSGYLKASDMKDSDREKTQLGNSYLDLDTEIAEDAAPIHVGDEALPSTYLRITDDSLLSNVGSNVVKTNHEEGLRWKPKLTLNNYLGLAAKGDEEIAEDSEEMPSAYLKFTDEDLPFKRSTNDVLKTNQEDEMSSSYLITREIRF